MAICDGIGTLDSITGESWPWACYSECPQTITETVEYGVESQERGLNAGIAWGRDKVGRRPDLRLECWKERKAICFLPIDSGPAVMYPVVV